MKSLRVDWKPHPTLAVALALIVVILALLQAKERQIAELDTRIAQLEEDLYDDPCYSAACAVCSTDTECEEWWSVNHGGK